MIKETVQAVGTTHIVTETGSKTLLGNRQFEVGDSVWTHGNFAFGTERNYPAPMIIPVSDVSSGLYIISAEYNAIVIRDASQPTLPAVKTIPLEMGINNPSQMCAAYNKAGTKLSILSIVDSTNTVTIKTIDNGVLTDTTVTLPCEAIDTWLSNYSIIASYEADDLVWSIYCAKHDGPPNQPQNLYYRTDAPVISAIYEYQNTTLINTIDFADKFENDLLNILRDIVSADGFATINQTNEITTVKEYFVLKITTASTASGPITITINGTNYNINILDTDTKSGIARRIALDNPGLYGDGWGCAWVENNDFVTFSRVVVEGVISTMSFSGGATGTVGTFVNQSAYHHTADIAEAMTTPALGITGQAELLSIRNKEITLLQDGPAWTPCSYKIIFENNPQNTGSITAADIRNAKFKAKYDDSQRTLLEQHLTVSAASPQNGFTKYVDVTGGIRSVTTTTTCNLVPAADTSHNVDLTTDIGPLIIVINGFTLQSENGVCKLVNGEQEIDITSACGDYPPTVNSVRTIIPLGNGVIIAGSWMLFYIEFATGTMESINGIQGFSLNTSMPLIEGFKDAIVASLTTT